MADEHAFGLAALQKSRSERLRAEARRVCGRAAELAGQARAARESAFVTLMEARHTRAMVRIANEEAAPLRPFPRRGRALGAALEG